MLCLMMLGFHFVPFLFIQVLLNKHGWSFGRKHLYGLPPLSQSWVAPAWNSVNGRRLIDKRLFSEKWILFSWKGISGGLGSVKRHLLREGSGSDGGDTVDTLEFGLKAKQSSVAALDSPTPQKREGLEGRDSVLVSISHH